MSDDSKQDGTTDETRFLVLGDSHILTMKWAADAGLLFKNYEFVQVDGATAVGLRNPNSLSNAMPIFEQAAFPVQPHTVPVIQLGEVDCGFVIWWRAVKYGETIDEQAEASITSHFAFVDRLLEAGYPIVIITGATMPTIQDGQDWGEVANLRREVTATLRERTALTLRYNERLEYEASRRGLPYVDISSDLLDEQTGVLRPEFRNADPTDHHLAPDKAGPLWAKAFRRALSCSTQPLRYPAKGPEEFYQRKDFSILPIVAAMFGRMRWLMSIRRSSDSRGQKNVGLTKGQTLPQKDQ